MRYLLFITVFVIFIVSNSVAQENTSFGTGSGTLGSYNTNIGFEAGKNNTGLRNTFLGYRAAYYNTGANNTFVGFYSGYYNTSGQHNTFVGLYSGRYSTTGSYNLLLGNYSGYYMTTGEYNTYLGSRAGFSNQVGDRNVFLGNSAGYYETGSDKLYIDNSSTTTPLIYGEFDNDIVAINGKLYAEEIIVQDPAWSDFVFEEDYSLKPLNEVEQFIKTNKHLPEIPSEKEVKENGVSLGEMQSKLLQKVEELTLYMIDLKKENDALKQRLNNLEELN